MSSGYILEEKGMNSSATFIAMLSRSYCKGRFTAEEIKTKLENSRMFSIAIWSFLEVLEWNLLLKINTIYIMKNKKSDRDEILEGDIIGRTDEDGNIVSPSMTFSA